MDAINPTVFDTPLYDSDLADIKLSKKCDWCRNVWRELASSGLGKLYVFSTPRRFGNTTMALRIAQEGFLPGTNVTLVVNSETQQARIPVCDNFECVVGVLDISRDAEVVIFDNHNVSPELCAAMRDIGLTVLVFGKGIVCADRVFLAY